MLQVVGSNPIARSEKAAETEQGESNSGEQKALALPEPEASVSALPARAHVRVLDLLRAIDGAAIVGDLFAVRALAAAAVKQLEREAGEGDAKGTGGREGGGQ